MKTAFRGRIKKRVGRGRQLRIISIPHLDVIPIICGFP
jgi:hypothetical protein